MIASDVLSQLNSSQGSIEVSKSKRRAKTSRRRAKSEKSKAPAKSAAERTAGDPSANEAGSPSASKTDGSKPEKAYSNPPAKNLPMLIAASSLLLIWLTVLVYLAVVSISR